MKKVAVIVGSESDIPTVRGTLKTFEPLCQSLQLHVISCHRNAEELVQFVRDGCGQADVIIGVGGAAFAQPGVLVAWIQATGQKIPVIGVAFSTAGNAAMAALVMMALFTNCLLEILLIRGSSNC